MYNTALFYLAFGRSAVESDENWTSCQLDTLVRPDGNKYEQECGSSVHWYSGHEHDH